MLKCLWVYIRDVEKPILILVLLVDTAHKRGGRREDLVDKDEDGLLRAELDALADDVDELAHRQVGGDEVLLLVDGRDVALLHLLADDLFVAVSTAMPAVLMGGKGLSECMETYGNAIGVLLSDPLGFSLALLKPEGCMISSAAH